MNKRIVISLLLLMFLSAPALLLAKDEKGVSKQAAAEVEEEIADENFDVEEGALLEEDEEDAEMDADDQADEEDEDVPVEDEGELEDVKE